MGKTTVEEAHCKARCTCNLSLQTYKHLRSKPPGKADSSYRRREQTQFLCGALGAFSRDPPSDSPAQAGEPRSARAGPVKSLLWLRPGKQNPAPGVTIRTVGAGASGLTSETPRELSDPGCKRRRRWPPGKSCAGPSFSRRCRRFRVRHQEAPVAELTIEPLVSRHAGIPRAGLHSNRPTVSQASSLP